MTRKVTLALALSLISALSAAQSLTMTDRMVIRQAPVPTIAQPRDLLFLADKPGDSLIAGQKRSLAKVGSFRPGLSTFFSAITSRSKNCFNFCRQWRAN